MAECSADDRRPDAPGDRPGTQRDRYHRPAPTQGTIGHRAHGTTRPAETNTLHFGITHGRIRYNPHSGLNPEVYRAVPHHHKPGGKPWQDV